MFGLTKKSPNDEYLSKADLTFRMAFLVVFGNFKNVKGSLEEAESLANGMNVEMILNGQKIMGPKPVVTRGDAWFGSAGLTDDIYVAAGGSIDIKGFKPMKYSRFSGSLRIWSEYGEQMKPKKFSFVPRVLQECNLPMGKGFPMPGEWNVTTTNHEYFLEDSHTCEIGEFPVAQFQSFTHMNDGSGIFTNLYYLNGWMLMPSGDFRKISEGWRVKSWKEMGYREMNGILYPPY